MHMIVILIAAVYISTDVASPALSMKGGNPAAGSPTATLLRLHPSH